MKNTSGLASFMLLILMMAAQHLYSQKTYCTSTVTNQPITVAITTHPVAQVKCLGSGVTFSISLSGTEPYYYQWKKNGDTITGATGSTYTISSVKITDEGIYTCSVRNLCRVITSNGAELKVVNTSLSKIPSKTLAQATFNWNKRSGKKYIVFVKQTSSGSIAPADSVTYTANDSFSKGTQIGTTGWYCVYNGNDTSVKILGLTPNTAYSAMVAEYTGSTGSEKYESLVTGSCNPYVFTTLYATPSTQASNISFSSITNNSFNISCTAGNGSKRLIFVKPGSSGTAVPVNNITYTAYNSGFNGSMIGSTGWYCFYNDTGTSVNISGLYGYSDIFSVMVCEYNGTAGNEQYNIETATNNPANEYLIPATQATNVSFTQLSTTSFTASWNNGNGTSRAVFISQTNAGSASPVLNTTYTANDTFGKGSQIGTSGWYCIYKGTGTSVSVKELVPNATYRVMVFEFYGTAGREKYNTTTASNNPNNYYPVPTTQTQNITFTNYAATSFTASWTNGNGTSRAVFMYAGNSGNANPSNNTTYTASAVFGSGTQIGSTGWYCIYNGTGTSVNITGISSNTTYRVMVCDYNGISGSQKYNITTSTNNPRNYYPIPTTQAYDVQFSSVGANSMDINWANGNGSKRAVFIVQGNSGTAVPSNYTNYTANTVFASGTQIGTSGWYCVYNGTGTYVSVTGLSSITTYRVMVCEYNGVAGEEVYNTANATNNPSNQTTDYATPTTQASGLSFSSVTSNGFTLSWTRGNGSNVALFMLQGNSGYVTPSNNVSYNASGTFGSGAQVGSSGWYCIYNSTGTSVSVSGLSPNTTYRIMACEYNGTAGKEKYNTNNVTNNPNNQTTDYAVPTTQASNISFTSITDSSFTAGWTNGNGTSRAVFIKQGNIGTASPSVNTTYTANTKYAQGTQIGTTGWYCVYNGTGTSADVKGLSANTSYQLMVCDYNGTAGLEKYNTTSATNNPKSQTTDYAVPTTQAYNVSFATVTDSSFTISWTIGGGAARAVFIKATSTGTAAPANNTSYTTNTIYGSGSQIGTTGWYCIYNGTGTSVSVKGFNPNTTYRVMVCEYNGTAGSEKYNMTLATNNPNNQTTDYKAPNIQAYNITFSTVTDTSFTASWTNGNGSSRIVFIKKATSGSAIPVDNNTYSSSQKFGQGTQIGTSGWYCVYNSSGTSVNVNGLTANTSYQVMVCEYNGTSGWEKYNITTATNNPNNQTTDYAIPTIQANTINFSNVTATSLKASWTNGNGSSRVVFIKAGTTGTVATVNNATYTSDTFFTYGSQLSGWYCVYKGTSNQVTIAGLSPNTAYRMMVCEYNGISGSEKYNVNTATDNPKNQTTDFAVPTTQASNISFTSITDSSFTAGWTNGNGTSRAVFIKQGNTGTASPSVNTTYTANTKYAQGTQIGTTGWYCVYNGTGTTADVKGLTANTSYQLMVCDYNGTAGLEKYNTTSATNNPKSQTTDYAVPATQATNISFTSVTSNSLAASWTNGNGTARIVFMKAATSGTPSPQNNTTYSANSVFGAGSQIGATGWFCVYDGSSNNVSISGLNPNTSYRLMVCEYNGTTGVEKYNINTSTNNPNNQTTDYAIPSVQATAVTYSNVTDSSFNISWTSGNGSSKAVFIKSTSSGTAVPVINTSYAANSVFGQGDQIGSSGWYCVYNGTSNTVSITALSPVTSYRVMVCEYNGTAGLEKYNANTSTNNPMNQTTDYATPTIQAHALQSSSVLANSFTLSWSRGNGSRSIAFIKSGSTGTAMPDNNSTYTANPYFGSGSMIGATGWYCIYNGFDTFVSVSGISPNTTYRLMVCEYNGLSGSEKYNTNAATDNPINVLTDFIAPTIQSSAIQIVENSPDQMKITWSRGNGSSCIAFIKGTTIGSGAPINNTSYTADTVFGVGSQLGTSGWFCFYKGTGNEAAIYGLNSNKNYRIMICEYNGTAGKEKYKTDPAFDNPLNTLTLPGIFSLSGGGAYCADKIPTGIKVTLDSTETGVTYQLLKNTAPLGTPINGNNNPYTWNDQTKGVYTVEASNTSGSILMNGNIVIIENPLPEPEIIGLDNEYCLEFPSATLTGIPAGGSFSGKGMTGADFTPTIAGTGKHKVYYSYIDSKGCKNTDSAETTVQQLTVDANSPSVHCGQEAMLLASAIYTGNDQLTYKWTPEEGLSDSDIKDPVVKVPHTTKYYVTVSSELGCTANDSSIVSIVPLPAREICVVTVDTSEWKNKVLWVKPVEKGPISGFNVYKETSFNNYQLIATVPYENSPQIIDMASVPEQHGEKYKISVSDTCGYESKLSFYHKTINLTISKDGNTMGLRWDAYEDESGKYTPSRYYIYRGSAPNKLHLYDSVSGSLTSYNDLNIFSVYYYMVGVVRENCNDTTGPVMKVVAYSNKKDNQSLIGIQEAGNHYKLSIFPNPFKESTTIKLEEPYASQGYTYTLYDCTGKALIQKSDQSASEFMLEKGELKKGIYFIEIDGIAKLRGKVMIVE